MAWSPHFFKICWARGFLTAFLLAGALSLFILSMGLPLITNIITTDPLNNFPTRQDFGLWRDCQSTQAKTDANGVQQPNTDFHICDRYRYPTEDSPGHCGSFNNAHQLIRGTAIMALFFCVLALCAAMTNALGGTPSKLTLVPIILLLIVGLIAWVAAFVLYARGFCDGESFMVRKATLGAAGPCLLVGWLFAVLSILTNCILPSGPHDHPKYGPQALAPRTATKEY